MASSQESKKQPEVHEGEIGPRSIKCVVIDDDDADKTHMLCSYTCGPEGLGSYVPRWVPEITHHCPETPFLIVGTKINQRDDPLVLEKLAQTNQKPVTVKQGEKLARELGAAKYVECSALTQEGLENVFDEAILATLEPSQRDNKKKCSIL